jgi:hypothetical protein
MTDIMIDKLEVRLKGVEADAAHSLSQGLGRALLLELVSRVKSLRSVPVSSLGRVDVGTLRVDPGAESSVLQKSIAGGIARSIESCAIIGKAK